MLPTIFLDESLYTLTQPANIGPQDVPRTSPSMSPGRPLKILFDRPRGVPICRPGDVLK